MALFEEPPLFLPGIKKLLLDGYQHLPLESDAQIRSQSEQSDRSRIFSAALGHMTELKEFSFRDDYIPETLSVLASSSLTKLFLEKCRIDQHAVDALTQVIQNCSVLKIAKLLFCTKVSTDVTFTRVFSAVSECTSIRYFTFEYDGRNLDCREFDSVIHLIQASRTLRKLQFRDIFCSISQMCRALDALRSNTSIREFENLISYPKLLPIWPKPSKMEEATLNTLLFELISLKNTLTYIDLYFGINKGFSSLDKNALLKAFRKNNLSYMMLQVLLGIVPAR